MSKKFRDYRTEYARRIANAMGEAPREAKRAATPAPAKSRHAARRSRSMITACSLRFASFAKRRTSRQPRKPRGSPPNVCANMQSSEG